MQIRATGLKRTPCEKRDSRDKQNRPELEKISSAETTREDMRSEQQQRRQNTAEQSRDYQQKGL